MFKKTLIALAVALIGFAAIAEDRVVTWTASPPAEQVTSYDVQLQQNGGVYNVITNTAATTITLDLTPGNEYNVRIVAKNLAGDSVPSDSTSTGAAPSKPAAPVISIP